MGKGGKNPNDQGFNQTSKPYWMPAPCARIAEISVALNLGGTVADLPTIYYLSKHFIISGSSE